MTAMQVTSAITLALASITASYQIPANLQAIYDAHKSGVCSNVLKGGFSPGVGSSDTSFVYCGDLENAIYLHSDENGGQYADMDTDCDGANLGTGKCSNDPTGQGQTSFKDTVQSYGVGIGDLDANVHPFVVLGNSEGAVEFDPQSQGVEPLSVVAVVCGGQVHYGVWGDTNGSVTVGEASMALADLCFPNDNLSGDEGHGDKDVLYIAFKGQGAVPGAKGADWSTKDPATFENSLKKLGDSLVANLG